MMLSRRGFLKRSAMVSLALLSGGLLAKKMAWASATADGGGERAASHAGHLKGALGAGVWREADPGEPRQG